MKETRILVLLVVSALFVTGCGDAKPTILCGSSFRAPMEKLVEMYSDETGKELALSFGGSEDHFPHVKMKARGDLYVTHTPFMQDTEDAGSLLREVPVGYNAPVLVVAKGNPKNVTSIDDLTKEGLRVMLPDPEFSTCGEMVFALLEKKGILDDVLKNVGGAQVRSHADIGNAVGLGSRDAGIMWNGPAHEFLDKIEIVPTPYEYETEIRVSVMGLSYTKHPEDVQAFLDFVEKHGPTVFEDFGYVK